MVHVAAVKSHQRPSGIHGERLDSQYNKCCFDKMPILTGGKITCLCSIIVYISIAAGLSVCFNWLWALVLLYALISPVMIAVGLYQENYLFFSIPIALDVIEIFFAVLYLLVVLLLGIAGYESKHLASYKQTSKEWYSVDYGWLLICLYTIYSAWKVSIHYSCYKHLKAPIIPVPTTIYA